VTTCPLIVCFMGRDHLYERCPHFQRDARLGGSKRWDCTCHPPCDPLDESVCGWCRRVWRARHDA